jgi:hypothetical protein
LTTAVRDDHEHQARHAALIEDDRERRPTRLDRLRQTFRRED